MDQILRIGQIIMPTQLQKDGEKMVQMPDHNDYLQLLMCDSDLDALGRQDSFITGENLRRELNLHGIENDLKAWAKINLAFQEGHRYFTKEAQDLRNETKADNTRQLMELVN